MTASQNSGSIFTTGHTYAWSDETYSGQVTCNLRSGTKSDSREVCLSAMWERKSWQSVDWLSSARIMYVQSEFIVLYLHNLKFYAYRTLKYKHHVLTLWTRENEQAPASNRPKVDTVSQSVRPRETYTYTKGKETKYLNILEHFSQESVSQAS